MLLIGNLWSVFCYTVPTGSALVWLTLKPHTHNRGIERGITFPPILSYYSAGMGNLVSGYMCVGSEPFYTVVLVECMHLSSLCNGRPPSI